MKSVIRSATVSRTLATVVLVLGLAAVAPAGINLEGFAAFAERFTAFAVDLGVPSGGIDVPQPRDKRIPSSGKAGPVEFVINRYSSDAERDDLMKTLQDKGPDKLLDALQKLPRIGYFRTPNSTGYDLKFARKMPGDDGGERITMITDRYITFWEAANRPRSIDYPFTLIEVRMGPEGKGEGKLSLATRITYDKKNNTVVLEDYKSQPTLLNEVKRESTSGH
jgi:hypothetical protein